MDLVDRSVHGARCTREKRRQWILQTAEKEKKRKPPEPLVASDRS